MGGTRAWRWSGAAAALCLALGCGERPPVAPATPLNYVAPAATATPSPPPDGKPYFADRTKALGVAFRHAQGRKHWYIPQTTGSGVAMLDADGDGQLDLYFVQGSGAEDGRGAVPPCELYRQLDGRFVECARAAGLDARGFGIGVLAADLDNDGYTDVLVTQYAGPTRLFRANGDGTYAPARPVRALAKPLVFGSCAVAIDYDRDGLLDVYLGQYLDYRAEHWKPDPPVEFANPWHCVATLMPQYYKPLPNVLVHNDGVGWSDATARAGVADEQGKTMAAVATDFDADGWPDLLVGNDADTRNRAYQNRGDGTFADISEGSFFGEVRGSMGFAVGGSDGRKLPEVLVSHFYNPTGLYRTLVGGAGARRKVFFEDKGAERGLGSTRSHVGWAVAFVDVDTDGDEDILQVNGNVMPGPGDPRGPMEPLPAELFANRGDGTYDLVPPQSAEDPVARRRVGRSAAFGDLDRDGRVDVALSNNNQAAEVWLGARGAGRWVGVVPVGTRSAREGTGARVTVSAGERRRARELTSGDSYLATNARELHFGLGAHEGPVRATVRWPSGAAEEFEGLPVGRYHRLVEGTGRSI